MLKGQYLQNDRAAQEAEKDLNNALAPNGLLFHDIEQSLIE